MAVVAVVREEIAAAGRPIFRWGVTATDTGAPVYLTRGGAQVTAHAIGTFGGTVTIEATVDGVNWFGLRDMDGNDIALTADGYAEISTAAIALRPSAGVGVVAVDVLLAVVAL